MFVHRSRRFSQQQNLLPLTVRSLAAELRINRQLHKAAAVQHQSAQSAVAVAPCRCKLPFRTDSVDYVVRQSKKLRFCQG